MSFALLALHFYFYCYAAFVELGYRAEITDNLLQAVARSGLLSGFYRSKLFALGLLLVSLIGAKGKKSVKLDYRSALAYLFCGLLLFFASQLTFFGGLSRIHTAGLYIGITTIGYLLIIAGGTLLTRLIKLRNQKDIFNRENESFPQEERKLENEFSINLPAEYWYKGRKRKSWISIVSPQRSILVVGGGGSGKTYFFVESLIKQHLAKAVSMFVYDFKYDDLSVIAYNHFLKNRKKFPASTAFYAINFDDLQHSHRCNPLNPETMSDITDAAESARTLMLALNKDMVGKQGEFFTESPINFVTALAWFLRRYEDGRFCTLPHLIELAQVPYKKLFSILRVEEQIQPLISPFISAYLSGAADQLEGQVASATISLARLSSPNLYYILTGNDFSLDINNPKRPKVVTIGNNPLKTQTYGAVISLFTTTLIRLVNRKGQLKSSLVFDEFPTIMCQGIPELVATSRSNGVCTTICLQGMDQLRMNYGKEQADVIFNIVGNVIAGQTSGDTAKQLSERFGKIMQDRESIAINSSDTSITRSKQLDLAIPVSKIAGLSSGEFVGMVADTPDTPIQLKTFHARIINDHQALKKERAGYIPLPKVSDVTPETILKMYQQPREDVRNIVDVVIERIMNTPGMEDLIIKK
jgi:hypothetical protein